MKTNDIINIVATVLLAIIVLGGVYFIADKKISDVVRNEILNIEYEKVGGKDNFDFMAKSTADQLTKYREQYGDGVTAPQAQEPSNNEAQNNNAPKNKGGNISLDEVSKVKEGTYVLGNPNARISFVEYSDLECPFCKKLHESGTIEQVLENYGDDVNFIFKHFPLDFHKQAGMEAQALECTGELGGDEKYYSFIKEVFKNSKTNGESYTIDTISQLAGSIGVDSAKVKECVISDKYKDKVNAQMSEGQSFGITGTPGNVVLNNESGEYTLLPGAYPYASFKAIIDGFLSK